MNKYDYIIIGAGPNGLTIAQLLSKYNKKVAIIEKEEYIGGCHSVERINGLFTEHGPRIYISNYLMFQEILKDIKLDFYDLFVKYNFGSLDAGIQVYNTLSFRELFYLFLAFLNLNSSYKKISLLEYLQKNNFSEQSIDLLDRIGRLTDGGSADKYTLFSFLQIINQNILYNIYQPKKPNDKSLFKLWKEKLEQRKVNIYLETEVQNIITNNNKITGLVINNKILKTDNLILSMPPMSIYNFLIKNNLGNAFGNNFKEFSEETNYLVYIPVVFHWNKKLLLKKIWGLPQSDWGIGHIVLSDYMDFEDERSQTVISSVITKHNKSNFLNKTPDEISNKEVIIQEVFRQLNSIYNNNLPEYSYAFLNQNEYVNDQNKWEAEHTAFMTTKYGYTSNKSEIYKNLYNSGVHNGLSNYSFTSLESTIVNAIKLVHELVPESRSDFIVKDAITLRELIFFSALIIFILKLI
jgi:hypothetical protein